ncbi:putative N-acetylgalactosaminide beta-1,3-galactosyltransferase [Helianthus annuus]|nr:putative N-acetylgalactosaminide beta-1,3-galactosyltransferase [Helianthus annuus]
MYVIGNNRIYNEFSPSQHSEHHSPPKSFSSFITFSPTIIPALQICYNNGYARQHRHHSISSAVPWFFLSLLFLYIIYYSTLLFQPAPTFTTKTCLNPDHIENLQTNTSKETQTQRTRKEYLKLWRRRGDTRGTVWLDKKVTTTGDENFLPDIHISQDTSKFPYTNPDGDRSAIRISRIVSETLRMGLEDVWWFVMGDDDTVFIVENLVRVLSKYDHSQFYYIGSSESHFQNMFSYGMAFGGGGFAVSYPLAVELEKMQDRCLQRYPGYYGSDDRMHACMSELNVPVTKQRTGLSSGWF